MDLESQLTLATIISVILSLLAGVIGLLLTYLVIRQGVFHGLRAHTRWIDEGKDRRPKAEPYRMREDWRS